MEARKESSDSESLSTRGVKRKYDQAKGREYQRKRRKKMKEEGEKIIKGIMEENLILVRLLEQKKKEEQAWRDEIEKLKIERNYLAGDVWSQTQEIFFLREMLTKEVEKNKLLVEVRGLTAETTQLQQVCEEQKRLDGELEPATFQASGGQPEETTLMPICQMPEEAEGMTIFNFNPSPFSFFSSGLSVEEASEWGEDFCPVFDR